MSAREGRPAGSETPSETTTKAIQQECTERSQQQERRNAAMPARHRQRLRNLRRSPDALRRLGDDPAFRDLWTEAQRRAGGRDA